VSFTGEIAFVFIFGFIKTLEFFVLNLHWTECSKLLFFCASSLFCQAAKVFRIPELTCSLTEQMKRGETDSKLPAIAPPFPRYVAHESWGISLLDREHA